MTGRSRLPQLVDVLDAQPKATWRNTLTAEENPAAEELYQKLQVLMEAGGQTMVGTEVAALFLKRRIQSLMARDHQMWLYTGKKDSTRINPADFTDEDLLDEVHRLTCFNKNDNIPLEAIVDPFDVEHLPGEVSSSIVC